MVQLTKYRRGYVAIVGAGPGDPELITLKGISQLKVADVILYDALVSPELLAYAKDSCKKIFVGKRKGRKEFSQDEINQLLYFYANRHTHVVRLKGGDPYVFGRGHEEAAYLHRHGIETVVIPGISSAIAAPQAAGIPLTKRGVNESFWVVTGTLSSGELSHDVNLAAQSSATIIVLMGFSYLTEITSLICKHRSANEPMAVVQHATCKTQQFAFGTASTILNEVTRKNIQMPAVIIIGDVVNERSASSTASLISSLSKSY